MSREAAATHPASSYNGGVLQQALDIALFKGSHLVKVPVSKGSSKAVTLLEDQFPGEATLAEWSAVVRLQSTTSSVV